MVFSGRSALGPLLTNSAAYSLGTLVLLVACRALAYGASLSSFRGRPTSPTMSVGAAGGIALSHAPGLPAIAGAAMGIVDMTVVMLRLPLTSVLLATLLLFSDGLAVMSLVIAAVAVACVASAEAHRGPRSSSCRGLGVGDPGDGGSGRGCGPSVKGLAS